MWQKADFDWKNYESPIDVMFGEIQNRMRQDQENTIYEAVQNVGVIVDKEELVKALTYDRQQYEKGFEDGKAVGMKLLALALSEPTFLMNMHGERKSSSSRLLEAHEPEEIVNQWIDWRRNYGNSGREDS